MDNEMTGCESCGYPSLYRNSCTNCGRVYPVPSQDERLRELLSYCKTEAEKFDPDEQLDEFNPYDDVAYRLAEILDGES